MAIDVLQAAKYLCEISNWELTNLELHKILYLAHMVYLGENDGKPLIDKGNFQAWMYGPVHPILYRHIKKPRRSSIVDESIFDNIEDLSKNTYEKEIKVLEKLSKWFPSGSGGELLAVTHWKEGAWSNNYKYGQNKNIPDEDILEEYKKREKDFA